MLIGSLLSLSFVFLQAAGAHTDILKIAGLRLNPELKMEKAENGHARDRAVFYRHGDVEVNIEYLPLHDPRAINQVSQIQLLNVKGLFQPQKSPYRGQITSLVQCEKEYGFQEFTFILNKQEVKAILGGANSRRQIGACLRDDIRFWVVYFNYKTAAGDLVTTRIFIDALKPTSQQTHELSKRLKKVAQELFLPDSDR